MTKPSDLDDLAGMCHGAISEISGPPSTPTLAGPPNEDQPGSVYALDQSALDSIREVQAPGEADLLTEMIEAFLGDAPEQLTQLTDAVLRSDAQKLATAAHMLKSGAGYLGARELQRLCTELENVGRSGTTNGARGMLEPLKIAFAQTRTALGEELGRQDAAA